MATEPAPGDIWLAESTAHARLVHDVWEVGGLAPIRCTQWLAAEAPMTAALEARARIPARERGPFLIDPSAYAAWWLVPLDGAEELAGVRHFTVHPEGWTLHCPSTQRPAGGRIWLDAPDGTGRLANTTYLAAALGPAVGQYIAEAFG